MIVVHRRQPFVRFGGRAYSDGENLRCPECNGLCSLFGDNIKLVVCSVCESWGPVPDRPTPPPLRRHDHPQVNSPSP